MYSDPDLFQTPLHGKEFKFENNDEVYIKGTHCRVIVLSRARRMLFGHIYLTKRLDGGTQWLPEDNLEA